LSKDYGNPEVFQHCARKVVSLDRKCLGAGC
jgi:hypothetical protein